MTRLFVAIVLLAFLSSPAVADPDCTSPNAWPAGMAFTHLKNAGLVTNYNLVFDKTTVSRLASEKIGDDLYRQIHKVSFVRKSGAKVETITVNDASNEECSMSGVDVYVIERKLGDVDS